MREEDLEQFHVCGDHGDEVAFAFAGQFGGGETAQRREHLPAEQREQTERQIMVHVLFAIPHGTTDQRAHHHERDSPAHGQTPDGPLSRRAQRHDAEHQRQIMVHVLFAIPHGTTDQRAHHHERDSPAHGQTPDGPLSRRAQRHDAEHRQEGRGKMPECAEAARQHHERPQIAHLPQQSAHELEGRHWRALCVRTLRLFHIVFHSIRRRRICNAAVARTLPHLLH